MAAKGLIVFQSGYGPEETMNRFEDGVRARGMTIFAHIDHAASAASAGLVLDPSDLLIFGNAQDTTALMQKAQTIGIDLPLKALVWQDPSGVTWLSYDDLAWVAERHGLDPEADATLNDLSALLAALARAATRAT